jgi:hypothetical protein
MKLLGGVSLPASVIITWAVGLNFVNSAMILMCAPVCGIALGASLDTLKPKSKLMKHFKKKVMAERGLSNDKEFNEEYAQYLSEEKLETEIKREAIDILSREVEGVRVRGLVAMIRSGKEEKKNAVEEIVGRVKGQTQVGGGMPGGGPG